FFFQAEDGIRDFHVTGVQTCALPISVLHCRDVLPDSIPDLGVRTRMARSKTSAEWLKEHVDDIYVQKAQQDGYRTRASYKLLEQIGRASCRERVWEKGDDAPHRKRTT